MTPAPAPNGDFISTLEPILLILGLAMTCGVGIFLVWLFRHVKKEEREEARRMAAERDRGEAS